MPGYARCILAVFDLLVSETNCVFFLKAYAVKNGKEIMLAKSDEFVERTTPAKVTGAISGRTEKTGNYTAVRT